MPPKMFTCVICGENVSKPKSAAYGEGRACRIHPEVSDELAQNREQQTKHNARIRYESEHAEEIRMEKIRKDRERRDAEFAWPQNHCWSCGCEGITYKEHNLRMLIGMEKLILQGQIPNLFTDDGHKVILEAAGYKEGEKVNLLFMWTDSSPNEVPVNRRAIEIYQFTRCLQLCPKCSDKGGFDMKIQFDIKPGQLEAASKIYEGSPLQKEVQKLATQS